jgi:S-DNA-T family DNA segregation ATPase FtsK/SpoIIIE
LLAGNPGMKFLSIAQIPRVRELLGILCLVAFLAVVLSLATFDSADPSWNTASPADPPHNAIGLVGATVADFGYQSLGLSIWLLPVILLVAGWRSVKLRPIGPPISRGVGYALAAVSLSGLFELAGPYIGWHGSFEIGGMAGLLFATTLTRYLNRTGALMLLGTFLVLALYLLSSFTLQGLFPNFRAKLASYFPSRRRRVDRGSGPGGQANTIVSASSAWVSAASGPNDTDRSRRAEPFTEPEMQQEPVSAGLPPGLESDLAAYAEDGVSGYNAPLAGETAGPASFPGTQWEPRHAGPAPTASDAPPWEEDIPIRSIVDEEPSYESQPRRSTPRPETVRSAAWELPSTTFLNPPADREAYDSAELKEVAVHIKARLEEFNVLGNVAQINPGPVVTTFEFKPDAGVKIAKITTLSEDLCLGLQAESILIERIPGKPTVGIEVPNKRREMISLRQIIESDEFDDAPARLTFALGKDISGRIRVSELEKMPHLLIAGSTGSGKSVMLNTLIMSVLYKSTPDEVRMILVDPKRVELGIYDGIPHLLTPVITEPKKAVNALRNGVLEMERRLKLLASYGVRNIDQFNKKIQQLQGKPLTLFPDSATEPLEQVEPEKPLPYILIVIDELADLMMLERAGVEESVIRLAQMARAVGMHIVLATQRPSVDVITGLIKANFPARISFRVATRVDSRTVLDVMGAEHLLGKGDMLFLPPGSSRLVRVHGAFVTETEIASVVDFWKRQSTPEYDQTFLLAPPTDDEEEPDELAGDEDPLYRDAVGVVCEMGKASTSILQRRLRLGYGRAARILDQMQHEGIIGPPDGSRPRDIFRRPDWLDAPGG